MLWFLEAGDVVKVGVASNILCFFAFLGVNMPPNLHLPPPRLNLRVGAGAAFADRGRRLLEEPVKLFLKVLDDAGL